MNLVLRLALVGLIAVSAVALGESRAGAQTYQASALRVQDLIGSLEITVSDQDVLEVGLEGNEELLEEIEVEVVEDVLVIKREKSLLDWPPREIFKWRDRYPTIKVRVPAETGIEIEEMVGQAKVGDIKGSLKLDGTWLSAEIGEVADAVISLSGRGNISLGRVRGRLGAELSGSGDLIAGPLGQAEIHKTGSGDVRLGAIAGGLVYESSGSGDALVASVNGPVDARINGSGSVTLQGGRAEPLIVKIHGSGDFEHRGTAVDADITVSGSGAVSFGAHQGTMRLRAFSGSLAIDDKGVITIAQ